MATPPPPAGAPQPPNPGQGRLFGTNNLGSQIDGLTRAFTAFTNRFASTAGMSTMGWQASNAGRGQRTGEQLGRLQQRYQQTYDSHQTARQRMQDELERQQLTWDRQLRVGTRTAGNMRLPAWQRQEAQDRLDEQAILFASNQARTRREWTQAENQHSAGMGQMVGDMQRLQAQQRTQTTLNRVAMAGQVGGAVVGAARTYYSGEYEEMLGQFERRASLMRPDFGGSSGHRAQTYGREMKRFGSTMWGTSDEDAVAGQAAILQQNPFDQYATQSRRASGAAFVTPGLGIQGAAQMQQELGTGQAFYASQIFGLAPTRFAKGEQNSSAAMALSLAQRVNSGNFGDLSATQLKAQLSQGGSMAMSMANYGRVAGLSGQSLEAMRNQTELLRNLMNPDKKSGLSGVSSDDAVQLIEDAGRRDKQGDEARKKIKKYAPSVGDSYQDSQRYLQGLTREGHLPGSASYLDAAKSSANTLADIHSLLQKTLEPIADWIGGLAGAYKAGGPVGGTASRLKDVGSGFTEGFSSGWDTIPTPDIGGWAKGAWNGITGIFGGDSGTPESKQGKKKKKSDKDNDYPGSGIMKALSFANSQLGDRYILGANGPDAWDCSSLVQQAYGAAGVKLPRTTYQQIHKGVEVDMDDLRPGDLVFYKDVSHVGMYAGGGQVVEAANPGKGVVKGPLYGKYKRARRIMAGGVEAKGTLSGGQSDPTTEKGSADGGGGGIGLTVSAGAYGSVEEVDALAAALSGGGSAGTAQTGGSAPQATQNSEAEDGDAEGGGDAGKDAPRDVQANVKLGKKMAAKRGWTGGQWDALYKLWLRESGWKHWADNPNSDAYGIPQAMSNLYPETGTKAWRNSPGRQIDWGLNYIARRYSTPAKAWSHWQARVPLGGKDVGHWYADGAWEVPGQPGAGLDVKLHGGEMVLERNTAHTVRQALLNQGITPSPGQGSSTSSSAGPVTLQFGPGSVVVQMPTASAEGARTAAEAFVTRIAADDRIKSLMGGW